MDVSIVSYITALLYAYFLAMALSAAPEVVSLECWKCVADDCHLDPVNNYKANKIRCDKDRACQVEYWCMRVIRGLTTGEGWLIFIIKRQTAS